MDNIWSAITAITAVSAALTALFVWAVKAIVDKSNYGIREWADKRFARRDELQKLSRTVDAWRGLGAHDLRHVDDTE